LGAGPAGLMAAIYAASSSRRVEIWSSKFPDECCETRLECVPAQAIALLVETGVVPAQLGVSRLHNRRVVQWNSDPVYLDCPLTAHVSRPNLEKSLFTIASRIGIATRRVRFKSAEDITSLRDQGFEVIDATGRSSVTSSNRIRPANPIAGRLFFFKGTWQPEFGIVGLSDGYAYRLANDHGVLVGVVGYGVLIKQPWLELVGQLARRADWFCQDLARVSPNSVWSGVTTAQMTEPSDQIHSIGDALFARDILASQGLVAALTTGAKMGTKYLNLAHGANQISVAHLNNTLSTVLESPFRDSPAWVDYCGFLSANIAAAV
jgi:hypothetical protein